ncbi:hypothetical protein RRG08_049309 [Elysia crispata]|uniref:Uncharacterized protein n=1 Tax=Elysia crispata TaxID=231223 RepID=A0AAE1B0S9_9GAST|nr:hypothetical protein RRG08_049309 [Elysia crispata]
MVNVRPNCLGGISCETMSCLRPPSICLVRFTGHAALLDYMKACASHERDPKRDQTVWEASVVKTMSCLRPPSICLVRFTGHAALLDYMKACASHERDPKRDQTVWEASVV